VRALDIEARLTLCNMATEFSAMTGLIAPDDQTFEYLRGRDFRTRGHDVRIEPWRNGADSRATSVRTSTGTQHRD
jgi:3-isopropylmalate/(R)-2-methylmalate dehydratase large subunit